VLVFKYLNRPIVGVTGFEPATTRPPDVYATGLRHTPKNEQIYYFLLKLEVLQLQFLWRYA
jgi:hypothetical protein